MKIVFFGTPTFAADILAYLVEHGIHIVGVVSQKDKGKMPPVKEQALHLLKNVPILQPTRPSEPTFVEELKKLKADLFVVVAYGHILKKEILNMAPLGAINVHASLLPKYRGASPISRAILAGEKESGISIMELNEGMDAGNVLAVAKTPINDDMIFGELEAVLCDLAKPLLVKVLKFLERERIEGEPQNDAEATFAPKIQSIDCKIDFVRDAKSVHNQIRAFSPIPGAWTNVLINGEMKRLKIKRAIWRPQLSGSPGEILTFQKDSFEVACGKGGLSLLELQLEGKKDLKASDFIRGIKGSISFVLE